MLTILTSSKVNVNKNWKINIVVLGDVSPELVNGVSKSILDFYGFTCIIQPTVDTNENLVSDYLGMYDADKILSEYFDVKQYMVITNITIVTRHWKLYGYSNCPGYTSVVSTSMLDDDNCTMFVLKERLIKTALHEIGHNLGLHHCTTNGCIMNGAANGLSDIDSERIWLCDNCKKLLSN